MIKQCTLALAILCSQSAMADDFFSLPLDWDTGEKTPLLLASNDSMSMEATIKKDDVEYRDRMITANKLHKYLGIGSIAAAGLTVLMPKEEDGAHEAFGKAAAALGIGAIITGAIFHWDDINLSNGFKDPDNLHIALTTLGTLGFLNAVSEAPDTHAGSGIVGGLSMAVGINMVW